MVPVKEGQQGSHQAASREDLQERIEELEATMIKVYVGPRAETAHLQLYLELEGLPLTQHYHCWSPELHSCRSLSYYVS